MYISIIKTVFLFWLCSMASFVLAQSNYQPAVIIKNNGDSLSGKVNYRNWKNNPQTITFINTANEKQTFDASLIKSFYIPTANEIYISYIVEVDMRPGDQETAIRNAYLDSPVLRKNVFLLQLVKSPVLSLYQYTDNNKEHFYLVKGNEEPVELIRYYSFDESDRQVKEIVRYKEQLSQLFSDCPAITNTLSTIKFRKKDVEETTLKYIQCKAPSASAIDYKIEEAVSTRFGILAGVMLNRFKFEGSNSELADDNYRSSLSPTFGVALDLGLARNRGKWHLVNEVLYKSYQTNSSFTRPYNYSYSRKSDVDLYFSYIQINTILRYVYQSKSSLKPYINLGMGNAFIISENKNNLHRVYSFGDEENVKAFDSPNKYEFSLLGGVGLITNKIGMELRYGRSKKSFSPMHSLDINPTSFQFLVAWLF